MKADRLKAYKEERERESEGKKGKTRRILEADRGEKCFINFSRAVE